MTGMGVVRLAERVVHAGRDGGHWQQGESTMRRGWTTMPVLSVDHADGMDTTPCQGGFVGRSRDPTSSAAVTHTTGFTTKDPV
ncbi:MAG: hypothetical protein JWM10_1143 [Myxococcaceae bacterium]|nr:hypothetical protein [Myxococcaceae bacterium]